jgi:hypothetical protein
MSDTGGSGPLGVCFQEISSIKGLYYNQRQNYAECWEIFRRVELYNSNVSTIRSEGDLNATYWQFDTTDSLSSYRGGASLFYTYLGYSTIVQKN